MNNVDFYNVIQAAKLFEGYDGLWAVCGGLNKLYTGHIWLKDLLN